VIIRQNSAQIKSAPFAVKPFLFLLGRWTTMFIKAVLKSIINIVARIAVTAKQLTLTIRSSKAEKR
jgi:hypothetical protein